MHYLKSVEFFFLDTYNTLSLVGQNASHCTQVQQWNDPSACKEKQLRKNIYVSCLKTLQYVHTHEQCNPQGNEPYSDKKDIMMH